MLKNSINTDANFSEIGLNEILNQLSESKKLIIITTILFTILTFVYGTQKDTIYKSNVLIEIGNYMSIDNEMTLVEPAGKLVGILQKDVHHKDVLNIPDAKNINIRSIGESLVEFDYSSNSLDSNKEYLNAILNYTFNRHKDLFNKSKNNSIKNLKTRIDEQNYMIDQLIETEINRITSEVNSIKTKIPAINRQIELLNKLINEDELTEDNYFLSLLLNYEYEKEMLNNESNLLTGKLIDLQNNQENIFINNNLISAELKIKMLKAEVEFFNNINFDITKVVKGISDKELKPNRALLALLGFILGLTLSILMLILKVTWGNTKLSNN